MDQWKEFGDFLSRDFGTRPAEKQIKLFRAYSNEIIGCNRKINLTSYVSEREMLYYNFADSLAAAEQLKSCLETLPCPADNFPLWKNGIKGDSIQGQREADKRVLDIGSGAGFPGIPLSIMFPGISMALLESNKKKTLFLDYVKTKLGLKNVAVIRGRAEEIARDENYRGGFDIILSRAVARFDKALGISTLFAKQGGYLFFWTVADDNVRAAGAPFSVFKYRLPGLKKERSIEVFRK